MRSTAPLWTWGASIGLAVAVLAGLYGWTRLDAGRIAAAELNLQRIDAVPAGEPWVAIVGTSKVSCGILFDDRMTQAVRALGGRARIIKISRLASAFDDFDYAFEAMEKRPPRLLLIASDFFAYEPKAFREQGEPLQEDWREQIRYGLRSVAGAGRPGVAAPLPYAFNMPGSGDQPCPDWTKGQRDKQAYYNNLAGRRASSAAERAAFLARLRTLRARGTRVVLMRMPRSPAFDRWIPSRLVRAGDAVLATEAPANGLTVLDEPHLDRAAYLDAAHLNARGRALYSAWLARRIVALLASVPDV